MFSAESKGVTKLNRYGGNDDKQFEENFRL